MSDNSEIKREMTDDHNYAEKNAKDAAAVDGQREMDNDAKTDDVRVQETGDVVGDVSKSQTVTVTVTTADANGHTEDGSKVKSDGDEASNVAEARFGKGIQIIKIKERHGRFRKALPTMPLPVAITLCVVNCLLPGIGTFISGFTVFCGSKTEIETPSKAFWLNVTAAFLQLLTLPIVVGWIWSIIWGVNFITSAIVAKQNGKGETNNAPSPQQV